MPGNVPHTVQPAVGAPIGYAARALITHHILSRLKPHQTTQAQKETKRIERALRHFFWPSHVSLVVHKAQEPRRFFEDTVLFGLAITSSLGEALMPYRRVSSSLWVPSRIQPLPQTLQPPYPKMNHSFDILLYTPWDPLGCSCFEFRVFRV